VSGIWIDLKYQNVSKSVIYIWKLNGYKPPTQYELIVAASSKNISPILRITSLYSENSPINTQKTKINPDFTSRFISYLTYTVSIVKTS
jgi:hypothetical protein